ncbi:MAG: hypothetical protein LBG96_03230 [Tannerella sp.]|nr:hypothetical protein [Tannerella sp.]
MKKRLLDFLAYSGISQKKFEVNCGLSNGFVDKVGDSIRTNNLNKISTVYPDLNINWLKTGEGSMLKSDPNNVQFNDLKVAPSKNLIPFYDDVTTIGGVNDRNANTNGVSSPSEYIDTGDWFREATAAIRNYGDSMIEYSPGCILALKEVKERQLIIWGKDYVIETSEYRITKRVQRGKDEEHIRAYSSNTETYPDGQLVHEYLDVAWKDIRRIFLVLGYVVKKNGGTIVFSNQNK